jgi:pyocin large subunit-like protein
MLKTLSCAGVAALLAGAALSLSACNGGSASTAARDHGATQDASLASDASRSVSNDAQENDTREAVDTHAPVRLVDGTPMWAANRRHTAEENADYQFKRDGADFGAKNLDDFVAQAHAFVNHPPKGVLTLTRSNGDKLLYDAKRNIFAVVTKDGAPRTMFKPDAGKAYWDQQVARQSEDQSNGSDRRYSRRSSDRSSDDQG